MPDLQAQIAALRADGHKLRAFVSFYVGQEVAEFEADTIYGDSDYPLTSISGSYNSGSEADVKEGFLVEIRRAAGQLRRVTRTRYGATQTSTALKIRELSRAESVTGNTDLLIVRREVRISDKLVEATADFNPDGIAVGTFNSNPPPIANSGGLDVGFVDSGQTYRSVPFFGSLSFTVDPDSAGTVTHVWTIPTGGGAFAPGSASTDANPTIRVNVGHWLIQHAVTDSSNSVTTTQYIMVIVHDTTTAPPYECVLEPLEGGKEDGWNYRVQIFEDALETDIPYGSYAIVWVDETINGTTQSFGSPVTGRSHIKAVGIIRREETREDGRGADTLTFEIISPLARLGETPGFSKVMERNASPDAWAEIAGLKTLRASLQLIQFYCNINQAGFDVIVDAEMPSYDYPLLFLQKDSPLGQIRELTSATQGQFICDRRGRFMFIPVLNLLTRTARDNRTTALVFSRDDIIDIQVSQEHWRPIETFRLKGFTAHSTTPNPVFAKYPGDAPGQGNQSGSVERIICQNTATAYFFCGLYGAMEDGWFTTGTGIGYFAPRVTITVPGSYDVLDFYGEWIELDFSLRLRGTDLSAFRYELVRATVTYDGGTANCVFELQAETFGEPGVNDEPGESDTTGLVDWTDIWGTISFDPLLTPNLIPSNVNNFVVFARTDGATGTWSLFTCTNFQTGSPTFTETTGASLSVTGYFIDAQQNPELLTQWLVFTTTGSWTISDVWGTPTVTDSDTMGILAGDVVNLEASGYVVPRLHTHIAAPGFVVAQWWNTNAGTPSRDGHYIKTSLDFGATWSGGEVSNNVPGGGLFVSSHQAGVFFASDQTGGVGTGRLLKYSAYGATGPTVLASSLGTIMSIQVPHHSNSNDEIFLFSAYDAGDGTNVFEYNNGVVTDITPFLSGGTGCGFANLGVDFASTDRTRIRGVANRYRAAGGYFTADSFAGGYTESDDGGDTFSGSAAAGSVIEVVAIAGDNPDVIFVAGRQGGLAVSIDDGANFTDFSGDLPTGTGGDMAIVRFGANG